ncbi:MAG: hypothetical protein ACRDK3_10190 [Actinomycetota bacterium]
MSRDLPALWTPLLQSLCGASADQGVWKNVEAGLSGRGDVDFMAPRCEWEGVRILVQSWAAQVGLGPVIVCPHVPDAAFFLVVDRSTKDFLQLDVKDRVTFRGSTVFRPHEVARLMAMDPRGFRSLRAGAEGLVKLVVSGTAPGGRPKPRTLLKENVLELLASDSEGLQETAGSVFGRVEPAALAGAEAALAGGWNRRAMATVELFYALKGVTEPATMAGRLRARRAKRQCLVMRTSLERGRRIGHDVDGWLDEVARTHRVAYEPDDHD